MIQRIDAAMPLRGDDGLRRTLFSSNPRSRFRIQRKKRYQGLEFERMCPNDNDCID